MQTLVNKKLDTNKTKIFYSSSACIYPEENQLDPNNPDCREISAYPANPDSEYGWEKLFSERLYDSYRRNHNIEIRIARFHNIFGPMGTYDGGKEKVPAAICRKVALAEKEIEVWGDGMQTRSFLFIDECIQATIKLMNSKFYSPINIGSEEMVSINELVEIVSRVADKDIVIKHIDGPLGVRGRNSNNDLIRKELDWDYSLSLEEGIEKTYKWIKDQLSD
jgi:GDP-D-mannose 3',5'-epimerase